ncbi:MAG: type I restriction endonuclease subunit R, partial [Lentisphaerae bacterium]|nr:type I restriction endonuclease subunit R [Lentisphaerota bacterium]
TLQAMVAFSGEVVFSASDPQCEGLLGESFTETSMNPDLKGRDLRTAFDADEYHVMIVANKFQTGFDQPKLCAMYVDKKLGGVDCVQTLSRLNRTHPGKEETYILDFFSDPAEILAAFQEYYQTAHLLDVSDPNLIWDLFEKLRGAGIFLWTEVTLFSEVFFTKSKSQAAISNVCKPAVERWQTRLEAAQKAYAKQKALYDHAKSLGDAVFIANCETAMKEAKKELDALGMFKADLLSLTRYYEFMSQIVDYESPDLEKLSLYARHLAPLLREKTPEEDPIDLGSVQLTHYRLAKITEQNLELRDDVPGKGLYGGGDIGTGKARNKEEEFLSRIITRLNELFITDGLTDADLISYANTIRDKISENERVMHQIANNAPEQALLGDFASALDEAVMDSSEAHQNQMMQYLNSKELQAGFQRIVFDMLLARTSHDRASA